MRERDGGKKICLLLNEFQVAVMKHYNNKNVPYVFVMVATSKNITIRLQRARERTADQCCCVY